MIFPDQGRRIARTPEDQNPSGDDIEGESEVEQARWTLYSKRRGGWTGVGACAGGTTKGGEFRNKSMGLLELLIGPTGLKIDKQATSPGKPYASARIKS